VVVRGLSIGIAMRKMLGRELPVGLAIGLALATVLQDLLSILIYLGIATLLI
jgi:magnesium transporter